MTSTDFATPRETHPLDQTLAQLRAMGEWYAAYAGACAATSAWLPATEIACAHSPQWQKYLGESIAQSGLTDKRLHGYGLFNGHTWLMTTAAVACYLLDRRVPDLNPAHVRFGEVPHDGHNLTVLRFAQPHFFCLPTDPHAQHPDATVLQDESELRAMFHRQIETHYPPVMQALYEMSGYGPKAMWAQTSDNVINVLVGHVERSGQHSQLDALLAQFAKVGGSPLNMRNGVLCVMHKDKTKLMIDRASCCNWYRWPEAKGEMCMSCPRYSRAQRLALMLAELQKGDSAMH